MPMKPRLFQWPEEMEAAVVVAAAAQRKSVSAWLRETVQMRLDGSGHMAPPPDEHELAAKALSTVVRAKVRQAVHERRTECCEALVVAGRCGTCRQPVR